MTRKLDFDRRVLIGLRRRRERVVRELLFRVVVLGTFAALVMGALFGLRLSVDSLWSWALFARTYLAGLVLLLLLMPPVAHRWIRGRIAHPGSALAGLVLLGGCIWIAEILIAGAVKPLALPGSADRISNLWRNLWFLSLWWVIAAILASLLARLNRREAS